MIDHADQLVLNWDVLAQSPPHMVGDVELPGQSNRSVILASHHVEPLQLYAQHYWTSLYLVLFGSGHFIMTILAIIGIAEALSPEESSHSIVNVVCLSDVDLQVHEMLEGGGHMFTPQTRHILPQVASKYLFERSCLLCEVVNSFRDLL